MLLLFVRAHVDVHTNALCDYRQAHHQCVDDTQEYTLKWELQWPCQTCSHRLMPPTFLLCLTLQDK